MHFGERIRQAREIRGWTQEELASKLDRSKSLIAQVEAGFRLPSREIVEAVALATKLPLTFFNEEPHLEFPIQEILFRAQRAIKRREVLNSVRYAEHLYSIYSSVAAKVRRVPPLISETSSPPCYAAREVKAALGLPLEEPMASLIRPLERAGIVFLMLPKIESGDAFSVWVSRSTKDAAPLIAYSVEEQAFDRNRLSIAHELGHLAMHRAFLRKPQAEIEEEAFDFAAEWLMPEVAMRRAVQEPVTLTSLSRLKPIWGVSIASLIMRASKLRIITQRQYHYLFQQLGAQGWRQREPQALDVPVERPRLFLKMVEAVYGKPINFDAFASDTRVASQELRMLMGSYEATAEAEPKLKSNLLKFAR